MGWSKSQSDIYIQPFIDKLSDRVDEIARREKMMSRIWMLSVLSWNSVLEESPSKSSDLQWSLGSPKKVRMMIEKSWLGILVINNFVSKSNTALIFHVSIPNNLVCRFGAPID
ncbi:hypothetical protein Lal_00047635 [Lupinus albus]|nr:hypothetical protein Lal_00047635 [Lupinus albus]